MPAAGVPPETAERQARVANLEAELARLTNEMTRLTEALTQLRDQLWLESLPPESRERVLAQRRESAELEARARAILKAEQRAQAHEEAPMTSAELLSRMDAYLARWETEQRPRLETLRRQNAELAEMAALLEATRLRTEVQRCEPRQARGGTHG